MQIPHRALDEETLQNLIEEFVSREGTDYGDRVFSLSEKVQHVHKQLDLGLVLIVYDPHSSTSHIVSKETYQEGEGK